MTRRSVLRTTGQLAAAGVVASTAGCTGSLLGGGAVAPSKWVGAPDMLRNRDHARYTYVTPSHIMANEDHLSSQMEDSFESGGERTQFTGLDVEDVKAAVNYLEVQVMQGSYNKGDVTEELEDNGFDDEGEHGGFTIWVAESDSEYRNNAVGVSGNKLVFGRPAGRDDAQEVVEAAIDVGKGDEDRYAEESDAMKTLMNKLGTTDLVFGSTQEPPSETREEQGQFEGSTASGLSWKINGENSKLKQVWVFEDSDAADKGDVEDYVDARADRGGNWASVEEPNFNKSGNVVVAKGTMPTDEFGFF